MYERYDHEELTMPCSECSAGMMRPGLITYFTWLGEELITVPHFPAWVCDVCGRREYDSARHLVAHHDAGPQCRETHDPPASHAAQPPPPSPPQPSHPGL